MPGNPWCCATSWKNACIQIIHATSTSAGPSAAISQSRTATGVKSRYRRLPMRESPHTSVGGPSVAGRFACSHSNRRSTTG